MIAHPKWRRFYTLFCSRDLIKHNVTDSQMAVVESKETVKRLETFLPQMNADIKVVCFLKR
jgi:hypothetical protein